MGLYGALRASMGLDGALCDSVVLYGVQWCFKGLCDARFSSMELYGALRLRSSMVLYGTLWCYKGLLNWALWCKMRFYAALENLRGSMAIYEALRVFYNVFWAPWAL